MKIAIQPKFSENEIETLKMKNLKKMKNKTQNGERANRIFCTCLSSVNEVHSLPLALNLPKNVCC